MLEEFPTIAEFYVQKMWNYSNYSIYQDFKSKIGKEIRRFHNSLGYDGQTSLNT